MEKVLSEPYAHTHAFFAALVHRKLPPDEAEKIVKDSYKLFRWLEARGILPDDMTGGDITEYQNYAQEDMPWEKY